MIKLWMGDCLELMKDIPDNSIDMILTSPPYGDIKNYGNSLSWDFNKTSKQLFRVLKPGSCLIWVVGDQTKNGSESGESFRQALHFMDNGLNLHDTMIYKKINYTPLTHNRYEQEFEYIFCFSKGKLKTFNPIMVKCKWGGTENWGQSKYYKTQDDALTPKPKSRVNNTKIKGNIFSYITGSTQTGHYQHPAIFPEKLAIDQIRSWSNEGDTVLDCFMGSGTSGAASEKLNRNFIGIEKNKKYFEVSVQRIKAEGAKVKVKR